MSPISLKPSSAIEGGVVPVDRNLLYKECRFTLFEYPARKDGTIVMGKDNQPAKSVALRITYVDDDGNESVQHYSAGDPERLVPSASGLFLEAVGSVEAYSKSTNMHVLFNALVNAGFPENRLDDDKLGVSVLDGLYAFHIGVPEPDRTNLRAAPAAGEQTRKKLISVPSKIHKLPWDNKKALQVALQAQGPAAGAAKPAGAGGKKAPAVEESDGSDASQAALDMVAQALTKADSVTRQQLATKAIRDKKDAVAQYIFTPDFKASLLANYNVDGEKISAKSAE